ncbi:peptidoglycan-binding protein [Roseococcus sp. YIM B11640]|uniref:peptidoglycan-binding protein n=1 Tax=Roseococcus sp. YIM B11640 TaxID=3133973 RepID=UPI003C7DC5F7
MATAQLERNIWFTTPMMRGDDVLMVQNRLVASGALLTQDGLYGRGTRKAVETFQRAAGLLADGVVGVATWSRLMAPPGTAPAAALQPPTEAGQIIDVAKLTVPHRLFQGSVEWSLGPQGISIAGGSLAPSVQEQQMVAKVMTTFSQALTTALSKYKVPVELVVATICTESGGNPMAKRMEPGCDRDDPSRTPMRVSWGLMQTLLGTAREVLGQPDLPLAQLLEPEVSIRAGAAYMWRQARRTGFDPPLVAAAYNAGSLRWNDGPENRWKMVQYPIGTGHHVDRFCRFLNAAMTTDAALPSQVPSLREILGGAPAARTATVAAPLTAPAPEPEDQPDAMTPRQFQEQLHAAGHYAGPIDGQPSPALEDAIDARFSAEAMAGRLAADWHGWSDARRQLAVEQSLIRDRDIFVGAIDGLIGPQTRFARQSFQHLMETGQPLVIPERDEDPPVSMPAVGKAMEWPRQSEVSRFYGAVGTNQVMLVLPYTMRIAWDTSKTVTRFQCHEKVHDAFLRVFQKTLAQYGPQRLSELRLDLFGGCLNVRPMRGGTRMSMHSWGIAIDLDPARNALDMHHDKASFARDEYIPFWRIVESEGLVSLGRVRDFDWMHFQAARL